MYVLIIRACRTCVNREMGLGYHSLSHSSRVRNIICLMVSVDVKHHQIYLFLNYTCTLYDCVDGYFLLSAMLC